MLSAVAKRSVFFELFRIRADSQSLGFKRGRFRHLDPRIERHELCDLGMIDENNTRKRGASIINCE